MNVKLSTIGAFVAAALSAGPSQASGGYTFSLLAPTAEQSSVSRINDFGRAAGTVINSGMESAVVWDGTVATALAPLSGSSGRGRGAGINNAGQVVGAGTLWNAGVPQRLPPAFNGGGGTAANSINNFGVAVGSTGSFGHENTIDHATRWDGGVATDLGTIGGNHSYATDVNDAGVVVGMSSLASYDQFASHAALWSGGTVTNLGTLPGGDHSQAYAINSAGVVVGSANTASAWQPHAVIWQGSTITELVGLGGKDVSAGAYGINDAGLVVGGSSVGPRGRATLWKDGVAIDLNNFLDPEWVSAGWVLASAMDINNHGWIVGRAENMKTSQIGYGFMLSIGAVPEPGTYAMLLAGLGLMGVVARRQRRV